MERRTLVPDADEVALDQLMVENNTRLVMVLRATGKGSRCPVCHQETQRIHSRYRRRLSDLPWEGIPVRIELRVRRFFCDSEDCGQQIFTERLPKTVLRYSRRTCRLSVSLQQITSALGGSAGSRLAKQLGILASGSTLLRQLRRKLIKTSAQGPRVLGIDDWAWRKGHRYGTILCDLERGKVVDLLPDRSAESTAQWLRAHPGTEIVSRDRASLYAQAATAAVPQAVQVADRWHLLHNLTEAFIGALVPHHRLLSETARALAKKPDTPSTLPPADADKPTPRNQAKQRQNREHRLAIYEAVMEQVRKGVTQREIARSCDVGIRTIRRWIRAQVFPERRPAERRSKVDRYREYLEQRWNEGCHNATQLWHELRARGFTGQSPIVRRWVRSHFGSRRHRTRHQTPSSSPQPSSPRQTAWILLKEPEDARTYIAELCRRSTEIATCADLAREFVRIIRQRDGVAWPNWKDSAKGSLLASFAKHLCHDEAALLAALQQPWSNGPVEGHVHRLKLIKRSMYGRAKFDLLRLRVVNAD
ncbi:MAG: ISL3 family transposase [Rhodanobacter sp.]